MQIDNKDGGQEVEAPYRWMWEEDLIKSGRWSEQYDDERPAEHPQVRNIRPLYARPQPASTALVERLTKALEPFAAEAAELADGVPDDCVYSLPRFPDLGLSEFDVGDLREARSALSSAKDDK